MTGSGLRILYLLYRYPQLSQTFVRNEIYALRARGATVDVVSIEPGDTAGIAVGWAGPVRGLEWVSGSRAGRDLARLVGGHPIRVATAAAHAPRDAAVRRLTLRRLPSLARRLLAAGVERPAVADRHPAAVGGYDRVHTHFAWDSCWVARQLGDLLGVPASVTVHARDIYDRPPGALDVLETMDDVVTVCRYNVDRLRAAGIRSRAVQVVPCGVDVDVPLARSVTGRPDPGIRPGPDVIAVGRLVEKKGFDTLVAAVNLLRERGIHPTVQIVGAGPELRSLRAAVERFALAGQVDLTGAVDHDRTLELMGRAALCCLPCRPAADGDLDALPVVLREAQARGLPVIATTVGGIGEAVDAGSGWLIPPADPEALAAALAVALSDPEQARRRGLAGRDRVRLTGSLTLQASLLEAVFRAGQR